MSVTRPGLPAFNAMDDDAARERLLVCLDVPRWADAVLAGRPFATLGEIEAAMTAASATSPTTSWSRRWPGTRGSASAPTRRSTTPSTPPASSPGSTAADVDLARRLEEGNRAYEERFGRVFIVRAAGRSGRDILEHLRHRLANTDELERAATIDQLTQIAVLRMKEMLS